MTKVEQTIERTVVTFFEAAVAYLIVIPTTNWGKTAIAGAIGFGLSAVYNILRIGVTSQSEPPAVSPPAVPPAAPSA